MLCVFTYAYNYLFLYVLSQPPPMQPPPQNVPPPQGGGMPMTQGAPPPQRPPERPPPPQTAGVQAVTQKVGQMTLQQQQYKVTRLCI